jgi:hypothetical protein
MELVKEKSVYVEINGETLSVPVSPFKAPVPVGSKSFAMPAMMMSSNGTGTDPEILCHVLRISSLEANLSTVTQIVIAKEELVDQVHNDENNLPNQSSAGDGKVKDLEPWQMP